MIGRYEERKLLEEMLHQKGFGAVVCYGRRRVGKTYLIQEILKDCQNKFVYQGLPGQLHSQLRSLERSAKSSGLIKHPHFEDLEDAFDQIFEAAEEKNYTRIIHEKENLPGLRNENRTNRKYKD